MPAKKAAATIKSRLPFSAALALLAIACGVSLSEPPAPVIEQQPAELLQPPIGPTPATRVKRRSMQAAAGGGAAAASSSTGKTVSALDASLVLRHIFEQQLDERQQVVADVNLDGAVTISDAQLILQRAVGLIDRFPVATKCGSVMAFFPVPKPECGAVELVQPGLEADGTCRRGAIRADVQGQRTGCDFEAACYGDVTFNGSAPCS